MHTQILPIAIVISLGVAGCGGSERVATVPGRTSQPTQSDEDYSEVYEAFRKPVLIDQESRRRPGPNSTTEVVTTRRAELMKQKLAAIQYFDECTKRCESAHAQDNFVEAALWLDEMHRAQRIIEQTNHQLSSLER